MTLKPDSEEKETEGEKECQYKSRRNRKEGEMVEQTFQTFGRQHVIYDWLLCLDVMTTNYLGEVVQNFIDIGNNDAPAGVGRELLIMMLWIKKKKKNTLKVEIIFSC